MVILVNGLAINGVRMRRYNLARALKARTRDWSPLPITSSTNSGLMRNYLDGDASDRDRTESMPSKEGPVMRWRLRETEVRLNTFAALGSSHRIPRFPSH